MRITVQPGLCHALRISRQFEQPLHRHRQPFGILHFLQRPGTAQLRGDFEEVEQVRTAQHRFSQGRRLQQVMPAIRHQAAADKCAVRQGVEKQQLAHGVAQQH